MAVLRALWRPVRWLFATWPGRILFVLVLAFLLFGLRLIVPHRLPEVRVESKGSSDTLVVVLHGLTGEGTLRPMLAEVERHYPGADHIAPVFTHWLTATLSNVDAYELVNAIEQTIHEAHKQKQYKRIVLVGYSMGALLARKTVIWGYGEEEDRVGCKGPRDWVEKIDRVVSLAGMSRGWSIDPAPSQMSWLRYALYWVGERFARLTGTGKFLLSMQRGAPFVADSRVQWIRIARQYNALPPVLHLLGDRDDVVSIGDSRDLAASAHVVFVTLADTDHGNIIKGLGTAVREGEISPYSARRRAIGEALGGDPRGNSIARDKPSREPLECVAKLRGSDFRYAERIVYIMHGIRDYADWADRIGEEAAKRLEGAGEANRSSAVFVPAKYGYFPMIPFLLYYDRHKNVRRFMDAYTNSLADMPCLKRVDYLGHSNGTYILASALQHYKTLEVNRVYFAGSVVPKHYPWIDLGGRVDEVHNVVASSDWVVAFFPRLFEQVAEWLGTRPTDGPLDLGSAGFRGFEDGAHPSRKVRNIRYVRGGHGAGVDVSDQNKLNALVGFVLADGQLDLEGAFRELENPSGAISFVSNISWAVWLLIAALLTWIGRMFWRWRIGASRPATAVHAGRAPFWIFVVVLVMLLFSI